MHRTDLLRAISAHIRQSHVSAMFVVGWFSAVATDEQLGELLEAIHRAEQELLPDGHLAAYAERWGRRPDPRG
jgi:hypothetical protein